MSVERNINLSYVISCLMWARFFIPVLALFYIASAVPIDQFSLIMSLFSLSILLLEIPSGAIADVLGRKYTLIVARACYVVEIFLIAFFNGFWPFLIAKLISGVGVSLSSGASEALLYDSLKRLNRKSDYKRVAGVQFTVSNISMAFVFIIGSLLFSINSKLPAIVSLPFISLGLILTFFYKEPYQSSRKFNMSNSIKQLKEGLGQFKRNSYVKYLVFYSIPIATIISISLSISSAFFQAINIPVSFIGVIAFIASLTTAFFARRAKSFDERFGERKLLHLLQLLLFLGTFLMSFMLAYFGALIYLLIPMVSGLFGVIVSNYVNEHIESSHRATILSIRGFFDNLGIFVMFPIIGFLIKSYSMQTALLMLTVSLIIYFLGLALYSRKLRISQIK